jgi:hypothetical protein
MDKLAYISLIDKMVWLVLSGRLINYQSAAQDCIRTMNCIGHVATMREEGLFSNIFKAYQARSISGN